ncbi:hypothetical protein CLOP_g11755, partial [Closterium sp. NIES-67]
LGRPSLLLRLFVAASPLLPEAYLVEGDRVEGDRVKGDRVEGDRVKGDLVEGSRGGRSRGTIPDCRSPGGGGDPRKTPGPLRGPSSRPPLPPPAAPSLRRGVPATVGLSRGGVPRLPAHRAATRIYRGFSGR